MKLFEEMLGNVLRFNRDIVGVPIPDKPQTLRDTRFSDKFNHLKEEIEELRNASTWEDQADALVDLIYVALGGLVEMGITPGSVFNEVHQANMKKIAGVKPERPNDMFDAVKPKGWVAPNLTKAAIPLSILDALSPVLMDITLLRIERGKQYNQGTVEIEDYFPFGEMSYYQMVHVKLLRAKSMIESGKTSEEMADSILDMLNYLVFWAEAIRRGDL